MSGSRQQCHHNPAIITGRKVTEQEYEKEKNVIGKVYEPERLNRAWQQVRSNAGAAGIDRMSVETFENRIWELGPKITRKLKQGTYRFKPARRVFIPKEGT